MGEGYLESFSEGIQQIGSTRLGGNGLVRVDKEGTVDRRKSSVQRPPSMK